MLEQAGNILSIAFIGIIILSALFGLIKGVRKSIFQLIFSIFFFILALLIIPFIAEALLDVNISFLKGVFPPEIQENVTTLRGTIPYYLKELMPEQEVLFTPGSETLEIVYGIVKLVLVIALFIVYFILSFTVLKLITLIIWKFVKPKEKVDKRRLLGTLVGGVRGLLTVLLISIPLAGLTSMYNSATPFINAFSGESNTETTEELESFEEDGYDKLLKSYDDTWVAKLYDLTNLDEKMFDSVFRITVKLKDKKESVKIRKELAHVANIFDVVNTASDGKIDGNLLFKLSNEDLEKIKENLDKTNALKLVQVVAVEYLYGEIKNRNLDKDYETHLTVENLKNIDLKKDIITLFNTIKIINRDEFEGTVDEKIFSFDKATATEIVNELAEIEYLSYLLPMGLNIFLENADIQELMTQYNIDVNDVNKPNPEELIEDFKNITNVYGTLKDLNVNNLEDAKNLFKDDNLMALEDEQIEDIVDVIFDFEVLDSNANIIAAYLHNTLEQQPFLQGLISKEEFMDKFDKQEVKYLLLLGKLLIENDVFNENINLNNLLTDTNINKLSRIMAYSKIISEFTPSLLEMIFDSYNTVVLLEVPSDVSYKNEVGEQELNNLFQAFKALKDNEVLTANFQLATLSNLKIRELSQKISLSKTITHNINKMVNQIVLEKTYEFVNPNYARTHWSEDEIYYTILTLKIFEIKLISSSNINILTANEIETISKSITVTDAICNEINRMNGVGGILEDKLVIPSGLIWYSTETEKGEVEKMLLAIKEVQGDTPLSNFNPSISSLYGKNKEIIFASEVIKHTFVEKHFKPLITVDLNQYFESKDYDGNDFVWYGENNDTLAFLQALEDLSNAGINYEVMNFDLFKTVLKSNENKPKEVNDAIVQSRIFTHSLTKMFTELIHNQGGYTMIPIHDGNPEEWGTPTQDGKLLDLLEAIALLP
jgi:hypothetical protein